MPSPRSLFFKYLGQTSPAPLSLEIESAQGVYMHASSGQKIIDFISGIAVSNLGHGHPAVVKAVQEQAARHMHLMVYGELVQSPQVLLASRLCSLLPAALSNVYFVNSGTEAVEAALKLARRLTGRPAMVSCRNAYHGSTLGALSVGGNESLKQAYRPLIPGTRLMEFNRAEDLVLIDSDTAAVILEPIQGEAGVILPHPGYLRAVRHRCQETGTLLIFDEIQTGFGRTGSLFVFQSEDVVPDILLLGKALGGGLPLGALVSSPENLSAFTHHPALGHITTFGGHPLSCAAALAALEILLNEDLAQQALVREQQIRALLHHPLIRTIRGKGLFLSLEFGDEETCRNVNRLCLEYGVLTDWFLFAPNCMRLAPPLVISEEETAQACAIILQALDEAARPTT